MVDTGSRDRTKQVARRHGARVADFPWVDDFSAARNHALDLARGEWILVVDCDEQLHGPSRERLRETVRDCSADAFSVELGQPGTGEHSLPAPRGGRLPSQFRRCRR